MSGLAKLATIRSYLPPEIASTSASQTPSAAIDGCRSYVATLRLGMSFRSSPGHGSSRPPLKKYVTWAYFSVSATWNCVQPALLMAPASDGTTSGPKTTFTGRLASYAVIVENRMPFGMAPAEPPAPPGLAVLAAPAEPPAAPAPPGLAGLAAPPAPS